MTTPNPTDLGEVTKTCPNPHCGNGMVGNVGCAICLRRVEFAVVLGAIHGRCVALGDSSGQPIPGVRIFGSFAHD